MPQHVLPPPYRPNPPPLPSLFPFWLLLPFHRYPTLPTLHLLVLLLFLSLSLSLFPFLSSSPRFLPRAPTIEYIYTPPRRGSTRPFIKTFPPRRATAHEFPSASPRFYFSPLFFPPASAYHAASTVLFIVPKREEHRRTRAVSTCTVGRSSIRASVSLSGEMNRRAVFNLIRTERGCFGINVDGERSTVALTGRDGHAKFFPFVLVSAVVRLPSRSPFSTWVR